MFNTLFLFECDLFRQRKVVSLNYKIWLNGAASIPVYQNPMNVHFVVSHEIVLFFWIDAQRTLMLGNPKCFSGDDFVSMANGERKLLSELRPGDRVLVMNSQKQIEEDEIIMMLDSQPKRPGLY